MEGLVKHWNGLPGKVMDSPPLEVFERHEHGTVKYSLVMTLGRSV